MLNHPTLDKLLTLKLTGLAKALSEQMALPESQVLTFEERLGRLVDRELTARSDRRLTTRLRQAKLRLSASLEDIDYRHPRGLDKALVLRLASCQWLHDRHNVLITGPTGSGKTWINGLVTNDKFCMSRQSQITLHWSRKPYRSRPQKSAYAPAEMSQQGGYHETPLADTASVSGDSRRHASVGPSLSTSPAMEPAEPADRHSQPVSFFALTIGGDV
jgi:IstB-like ATP binding protein